MTLPAYLALLDTLLRAAQLEDAKAAEGPDAMARWAVVAVPRWDEVSAKITYAEITQPVETAGWYAAWRAEKGLDRELTGEGAISPCPAGSSRDPGASPARTRAPTTDTQVPDRAILPAVQLRLE